MTLGMLGLYMLGLGMLGLGMLSLGILGLGMLVQHWLLQGKMYSKIVRWFGLDRLRYIFICYFLITRIRDGM